MKVSVIIKEPGKKPRHVNISASAGNVERTVGGDAWTVQISTDMAIICNGKAQDIKTDPCCRLFDRIWYGTLVFVGIKGDQFADVPITYGEFRRVFHGAFAYEVPQ